jgi:iron complex outermembrane receptor protein
MASAMRSRGAEVAAQFDVTPLGDGMFGVDGQYGIVRATFTDGTNVPRIAPMRAGGGVWWPNAEWYTRVGLLHAFAQNDVVLNETPTDGYNLLNERIRNHIFFKKAEVLQPGLGARLFTNVKF